MGLTDEEFVTLVRKKVEAVPFVCELSDHEFMGVLSRAILEALEEEERDDDKMPLP